MRFSRLMLAASGLATVALLGSSVAANAATINGPFYNPGEAGYQVQSSVNFNEVRTTVHVDPGSSTSPFIALQSTVNGGATAIIGLENIGGNYFLYGATDVQLNVAAGVPLPAAVIAPQLQPLSSIGAPAGTPLFNSQSGGSFFIEVHYYQAQPGPVRGRPVGDQRGHAGRRARLHRVAAVPRPLDRDPELRWRVTADQHPAGVLHPQWSD